MFPFVLQFTQNFSSVVSGIVVPVDSCIYNVDAGWQWTFFALSLRYFLYKMGMMTGAGLVHILLHTCFSLSYSSPSLGMCANRLPWSLAFDLAWPMESTGRDWGMGGCGGVFISHWALLVGHKSPLCVLSVRSHSWGPASHPQLLAFRSRTEDFWIFLKSGCCMF